MILRMKELDDHCHKTKEDLKEVRKWVNAILNSSNPGGPKHFILQVLKAAKDLTFP